MNASCVECGAVADPKASRRGFGLCTDCHAKILATARAEFSPRLRTRATVGPSRVDPAAMAQGQKLRDERQKQRARADAEKVDEVVAFVRAAKHWPVKKPQVEAALGRGTVLDRAIKTAVAAGRIRSESRGPVAQRGYYRHAAPKQPQQPLAA